MKPATIDKVLVIAPHADDAEFGMGGYLSRMVNEHLAVPTVGIVAGGDYVNRDGQLVSGDVRVVESANAMRVLGVQSFVCLNAVQENCFDTTGRRVLIDAVDQLIRLDDFAEVFVCLPSLNQDHEALFSAVLAAFRPGQHTNVKRVWAYEYPGHTTGYAQPRFGRCYVTFSPGEMQRKIDALRCHASQFEGRKQNHCGPDGARALAHFRGSECEAPYAELFWLVREIY